MTPSIILIFCIFGQVCSKRHNDNYFGYNYGRTWMLFDDDHGVPHYLNLTSAHVDDTVPLTFINEGVSFDLFTREHRDDPESLELTKGYLGSAIFKNNAPLMFIVHDWWSDTQADWIRKFKQRYLDMYDHNVILVGWDLISKQNDFNRVASRAGHIGDMIAKIIKGFKQSYSYKEKLICLGYGLGAHICGFTGKEMGGEVDNIVALDPSRAFFEVPDVKPEDQRLDFTDAKYVSVTYSCAGNLGVKQLYGHVHYFPNAGVSPQPGCGGIGIDNHEASCSHHRSTDYLVEAMSEKAHNTSFSFIGNVCANWTAFVHRHCFNDKEYIWRPWVTPPTTKAGKIYFATNLFPPYARGHLNEASTTTTSTTTTTKKPTTTTKKPTTTTKKPKTTTKKPKTTTKKPKTTTKKPKTTTKKPKLKKKK